VTYARQKKNGEMVSATDVKLLKGGRLVLWIEMEKKKLQMTKH